MDVLFLSIYLRKTLILLGLLIFFPMGCSINGIGFDGLAERKVYKTDTALIVKTTSRGFNLYTEGGIGIQLGFVKRELIFPVIRDDINLCLDRLISTPSAVVTDFNINNYMDIPILIQTDMEGIGLEISPNSFLGNIGVFNRRKVRIQNGSKFSMYFNNAGPENNAQTCAVFKQ